MKKTQDESLYTPSAAEAKVQEEQWQKSIPAQVFLNYFWAISYHLQHQPQRGLQQLPFFQQFRAELKPQDTEAIRKLLLSSWSTEWALRSTATLGSPDYLRYALHWSFPQAYYAVFASLQAFLLCLNMRNKNAEAISRQLGRLVQQGAYPKAIGFYALGTYPDFSFRRLPMSGYRAGLQLPEKEVEAQAQIAQFLRTTRRLKAQEVRRQLQANPQTALRSAKTGKLLQKWNSSHWQQINWRLGNTTFFDLLSRLKISASNKEIERFVEADIDFGLFHQSLLALVSYLNGLHEAYVAKAMGLQAYRELLDSLPAHLQGGFVAERLRENIEPLLKAPSQPDSMDTAA
jgi:hypothetical protein